MLKLLMVNSKRFWSAPRLLRSMETLNNAASMVLMAVLARAIVDTATELMPRSLVLAPCIVITRVWPGCGPAWIGDGLHRTEHPDAVKFGVHGQIVDLVQKLPDFRVQGCSVDGAVGAVGRLDREFADALQDIGGFTQCAFGGLHQADAVL